MVLIPRFSNRMQHSEARLPKTPFKVYYYSTAYVVNR